MKRVGLLAVCLVGLGTSVDSHAQLLPAGAAECAAAVERALDSPSSDPDSSAAADAPATLGAVCPEFAAALTASAWGESFVAGSAADLPIEALGDFLDLAGRYGRDAAPLPSLAALDSIVDGLRPFEPLPERSLWDRAIERLVEWLDGLAPEGRDRFLDWLRALTLPEQWRKAVVYGIGIALVLIVGLVVVNELRHAGVLGFRARHARPRPDRAPRPLEVAAARSLEEIRAAPPARQPALVLGLVVERVRRRYAGLIRASSTHREIAAAGRELGEPQHAALQAVAASAERATYGDRVPDRAELDRVLDEGRALLEFLEREPGRAT